ncbi:MAG: aminoacyl-tRNA hydrolase [Anaerolineae bacterium]|nr:aminoacyl-tRNA hydrolase [Anaerolineae bacterium]
MITITDDITIDEDEITFKFARSSGPGGQNVNRVETAAQLRFDVRRSTSRPEQVRQRLERLARNRITRDGILLINARRYRSQERNREDAVKRLVALVWEAAQRPRTRRRTRPSASVREHRLSGKKHRGQLKQQRNQVHRGDD